MQPHYDGGPYPDQPESLKYDGKPTPAFAYQKPVGKTASSDIKLKNQIIRIVYSIITFELISIVSLFVFVEDLINFFYRNSWLLWLFIIGTFVIMIVLSYCEYVVRKYPTINIILLLVFTVLEVYLICVIASSAYKIPTLIDETILHAIFIFGFSLILASIFLYHVPCLAI